MQKNNRRLIDLSFLLLFTLTLAGCGADKIEQKNLKLGVILSLTGPAAPYGNDNLTGLQVAQEIINQSGGIHGLPLELMIKDSAGEPAQAITIARNFAGNPSIPAIIGPTRTGSAVAVSKLLDELKIPMMSVGSTGDWASALGAFNEWTFRSTRVDTFLIEPLLRNARDKFGIRTIAIISTADDDWSVSLLKLYQKHAADLGLKVVSIESQMTGDTDRSAQLTNIEAAKPDGVIINTLSSDAPIIANQARKLGIEARFLGTAGFTNPETWKLAEPGVLDGTLVAENFFIGSDREIVKAFTARYRARFQKDPPPYAAYAFDGLMLVAEACKQSSNPLDRTLVREKLGNMEFEGVLGHLIYHGSGDANKQALILKIAGNTYEFANE